MPATALAKLKGTGTTFPDKVIYVGALIDDPYPMLKYKLFGWKGYASKNLMFKVNYKANTDISFGANLLTGLTDLVDF